MPSTSPHAENLALLRAILEAKFGTTNQDDELCESPVLARAAARIAQDARAYEEAREGTAATRRWAAWGSITPERSEWGRALTFAASKWRLHWPAWSADARRDACQALLSPFTPDAPSLLAFIECVDSSIAAADETNGHPGVPDDDWGDAELMGISWLDFDAALDVRLRRPQGAVAVLRFSWVTEVTCTVPFHGGIPLVWKARMAREARGAWSACFDFGSRGQLTIRCQDVSRRYE